MSRRSAVVRRAVFGGLLMAVSCDEPIQPDPDLIPPTLQITFPTDSQYDDDGDGLVDFKIDWEDTGDGVAPASLTIRALNGVNGPVPANDILSGWRVDKNDATGAVFHETIDNLLHSGTNQIEISVSDSAGNVKMDTVTVTLPPGQLIKTIASGAVGSWNARSVVVCPDDRRVYASVGPSVVVVDADSLKLIGAFRQTFIQDQMNDVLCVPGDPILYVAYINVFRFDRVSLKWLPEGPPPMSLTYAISQSRVDPNLLFVTEGSAYVGIIDKRIPLRLGTIPISRDSVSDDDFLFDLEVMPGDEKIYVTRAVDGGLMVVRPSDSSVRILDLDPYSSSKGIASEVELSFASTRLYVAMRDATRRGILELDTSTDLPLRMFELPEVLPQEIAISPSGKRAFMTVQDLNGIESRNVLFDLERGEKIADFARPRLAGQIRIDGGVAFHPHGKFIFVGRDMNLDVYLNRE
jgi:DNA-binding beta-propeller fold protein YncE